METLPPTVHSRIAIGDPASFTVITALGGVAEAGCGFIIMAAIARPTNTAAKIKVRSFKVSPVFNS
jgi:hypothetical protein